MGRVFRDIGRGSDEREKWQNIPKNKIIGGAV
jgi:hypothetical protein